MRFLKFQPILMPETDNIYNIYKFYYSIISIISIISIVSIVSITSISKSLNREAHSEALQQHPSRQYQLLQPREPRPPLSCPIG